jgi:CheY-like chemotaxis protein
MDRLQTHTFSQASEGDIASARSSLLIAAQSGDPSGLIVAERMFADLSTSASLCGSSAIADLLEECRRRVASVVETGSVDPTSVYQVLDAVTQVEAALLDEHLDGGDFASDVDELVDLSFGERVSARDEGQIAVEEFEIDDETFEIFRAEADELLATMAENLGALIASPEDSNALWEIRRSAHTFKGAAGIVGLKEASEIAHRMEDLLDKLVEVKRGATPEIIELIDATVKCLNDISSSREFGDNGLELKYDIAMRSVVDTAKQRRTEDLSRSSAASEPAGGTDGTAAMRQTQAPIVRVSLERLDELLRLSSALQINRSALAERLNIDLPTAGGTELEKLSELLSIQREIAVELHEKLKSIRMVRFGMLETRLTRTVHITSLDEGKKAVLEIVDPDVEIDTQVIDALVEPLLHLLKNAVVHGIESPETRRMIGKPEKGTIRIRVETDGTMLALAVTDDGAGISIPKLKERSIAAGITDRSLIEQMPDSEALMLIFDRGLTTADRIDLNAGRGVGMSIVKESVEARGGTVIVESKPQRGTEFTLIIPLRSEGPTAKELVEDTSNPAPTESPLVLVVDDSPSIRRHNVRLIESHRCRVITANDGAEALELLLSGQFEPDLIISDVEMPNLDGWELLEYVKTDENFGHIPVVMVTSLSGEEHLKRADDLGADAFLAKPLTSEALECELARLCQLAIA